MSELSNGSMLMKVMDGYEVLCLRGDDNNYHWLDTGEVHSEDRLIKRQAGGQGINPGMDAIRMEDVTFDTCLVFRAKGRDGAGAFNLSLEMATPAGDRSEG